jgi:hypothetical protein
MHISARRKFPPLSLLKSVNVILPLQERPGMPKRYFISIESTLSKLFSYKRFHFIVMLLEYFKNKPSFAVDPQIVYFSNSVHLFPFPLAEVNHAPHKLPLLYS